MEVEEDEEKEKENHRSRVRRRGGKTIQAGMERSASVSNAPAHMRQTVIVSVHITLHTDAREL